MNVLITGGSGFIGKAITDDLLKTNNNILSISRKKKISFSKNLKWLKADISKVNNYKNAILEFKPDILIHLSWDKIPNFSKKNCDENKKNSKTLLNFIFKYTKCKKIIISGSCFEYSNKKKLCKETDACSPTDYFAKSKLDLYKWLKNKQKKYKITCLWFRIFYAYGYNQRKDSLIPYLINNIKKNKPINLNNPNTSLDFINVKDVSKYFIKAIETKSKSGIYNIGTGKGIKLIKILQIIQKIQNNNFIISNNLDIKNTNKKNFTEFTSDNTKSKKVFKIKKI